MIGVSGVETRSVLRGAFAIAVLCAGLLQGCGASTTSAPGSEPPAVAAGPDSAAAVPQDADERAAPEAAMPFSEVQRAVVQVRAGDRIGSGFIFDSRGWVLTSATLVSGEEAVTVMVEGAEFAGRVIGTVSDPDLAVVFIEDADSPSTLELGWRGETFAGKEVFLVEYLRPVRRAVVGEVSTSGDGESDSMRIDAPGSPEGAGGPVVDASGVVVGIVAGDTADSMSASVRAVPIDRVWALLPSLVAGGETLPAVSAVAPSPTVSALYSGVLYDGRLKVVNAMTMEYTLTGPELAGMIRISGEHDLWGGPVKGTVQSGTINFRLEFPDSGNRPSIAFDGRVLEDGRVEGSYRADIGPGTQGTLERGTWSLAPAEGRP